MPTFTVEIQGGNEWQALAPAETVEDFDNAAELADWTGRNQTVTDKPFGWRVAVYWGLGTFGLPAATWSPDDIDPDDDNYLPDVAPKPSAYVQRARACHEAYQQPDVY